MKKTFILLVVCGAAIAGALLLRDRQNPASPPRIIKPTASALSTPPVPARRLAGADFVLIEKRARRMSLYRGGVALKTYRIALGRAPVGKKTTDGDGRTPEGNYVIDRRKANSRYHRALHVSYPNADDRRQAAARGVSPGGDIMIHGLPRQFATVGPLHVNRDWTLGCIAVTNQEIDEIWRAVPNGTPVRIVP